ncbi:MAG: hypothetical protein WCW27_03985 [Patescibacteria group bacterium]|jgi:hypothetical protein
MPKNKTNIKTSNTNNNSNTNTEVVTATTTATGEIQNTNTNTNTALVTNVNVNTNTVTESATVLSDTIKELNLNNPSWDMFLVGFFVVGAGLYGLSLGKDRIISIMISIYMALAVVAALPQFVLNVKINSSFTVQITAFFAVFVVLFFFLSRQAVLNSLAPSSHGKWWQVIIFSFLHVGLLLSVTLSYLPPQLLTKFSELSRFIFTGEWPRFAWIIAPILAMIFLGKNKE